MAVIIFCTSLKGAKKVKITEYSANYHIVSDNQRVHDFFSAKYDGINCYYKDQGYSQYSVSNQVISALDEINDWFKSIESSIPNFPNDVLFWENHAEGGQTTQRIQDYFLLQNSIKFLFDSISPKQVIIVNDNLNLWENRLIQAYASKFDLKVKYISVFSVRFFGRLWLNQVRPLLKEIYFSLSIVHTWLINFRKELYVDESRSILIQLCSTSNKHLRHTEPLVTEINKTGLQGIVFGWGAKRAIKQLAKKGLSAFELENHVALSDLLLSWRYALVGFYAAKKGLIKLQLTSNDDDNQNIIDIVLGHVLMPFFLGEVPSRLRLKAASNNFFSIYSIKGLRLWTRVLYQSIIVYNAVRDPKKIIFFWQPGWPYNIDEPMMKFMVPVDLVFALSSENKRILITQGIEESQIIVAGLPWLKEVYSFSTLNSKKFSRNKLGLPLNGCKYIFFDPGYVLLGWMSLSEQLSQLYALLEVAKVNSNVQLLVKPHPSSKDGIIEKIIYDSKLDNVHFFPASFKLNHILNSSDILVTKMSTLAVEAMCLNIPTIACMFHLEKNFMYYEEAVEYAYTPSELTSFLNKFVSDGEFSDIWCANRSDHMKKYLIKHEINNMNVDPNIIIASSLKLNVDLIMKIGE